MNKLNVYSIFKSISGEVSSAFPQGSVCAFIRLAGCNLHCKYCDTVYAQKASSGKEMTFNQIIKEIKKINCSNIVITGGEPLRQKDGLLALIHKLNTIWFGLEAYSKISIETNGTIPGFDYIRKGIDWVIDWKLTSSGVTQSFKNHTDILETFPSDSVVKFVIQNKGDFYEAFRTISYIRKKIWKENFTFAFSPVTSSVNPKLLYKWMTDISPAQLGKSTYILNVQLHKLLILDEPK